MDTGIDGGAGLMVTGALPAADVCATLCAVTITPPEGTAAGAVYIPAEEMVPTVGFPPAAPFTSHVTELFVVPETVALNGCDWPTCSVALVGNMDTEIDGGAGLMVTGALPAADVCATLCAVTITPPEGTAAGAVYIPAEEMVPTVGFPPAAPFTSHVTELFVVPETVALNGCDWPTCSVALVGNMDTEIDGGAGLMVTGALPVAEVCATLCAVTITPPEGTAAGAVYIPAEEMVPTVGFPPAAPFTSHVTELFVVPETVALNGCDWPTCSVALVGNMDTEIDGGAGLMVTGALPVAEVCATLCAVTITPPEGTAAGAVYIPAEEMVPTVGFPPAAPFTSHVTELFVVPETVALNGCDWPTCSVALVGNMDTEIDGGAGLMVTGALPVAEVCATLCAVTITPPEGTAAGAVYIPAEEMVPTVGFPPAAPFTSHVTELFVVPETVALNGCDWPTCSVALVGNMDTEIDGGAGLMVTGALPVAEVCATLCAVTITPPEGTAAGAVYIPAEEMVPTVGFPPAAPFTSHVTELFVVPETVALNGCDWPTCSVALVGNMDTEIDGGAGLMVTGALPVAEVCATLCAVTITPPEGTAAGAVYIPAEEMVPTVGFPPAAPFTSHVTELFVVPETVALNGCDWPTCSVALVGNMDTEIDGGAGLMVTGALPVAEVCATLCAVTITPPEGTAAGAVYIPAEEMVPTVGFPPAAPFTSHVTELFVGP